MVTSALPARARALLRELGSSPVTRYVGRRLLHSVGVVFAVLVIVFFLSRVVPADPAILWAGSLPTAEQVAIAREYLRLDEPLHVQFLTYLWQLLHLDLGTSIRTKQPVAQEIARLLPATLELVGFAFLLAFALGVPLGVLSAVKRRTTTDHVSRVTAILGVSLPSFWLAMILQLVFASWVGLFPVFGRVATSVRLVSPLQSLTGFFLVDSVLTGNLPFFASSLHHLVLPALALAAYPLGLIVRMVRTMMIEVLGENYIRTAKAFGLPRGYVLYVYALKNAIAPSLVILGLSFAYSLVGAFLVEIIFSWPGIGTFAFLAILAFDYPAILGVTLVVALSYILINLLVDLAQSVLDPRVALEPEGGG